jgi:four helix bundle protein
MKELIKNRTKKFAVAIINFSNLLPNKQVGWNISNQIIRSATSVGANYRAVCRAKSD